MKFAAPFVLLASLVAGSVGQSAFTVSMYVRIPHTEVQPTGIDTRRLIALTNDPLLLPDHMDAPHSLCILHVQDTSYAFVNNAAAGYTVEIQLTDCTGRTALTQYTILESCT
ncbi:hypothetical protein LXA43DRAFT_1068081 [Ganoderma leucocontextum]|nr:hypothetical protein LXA43DRAFT_1068081 [Ganoderma leucocontextum]